MLVQSKGMTRKYRKACRTAGIRFPLSGPFYVKSANGRTLRPDETAKYGRHIVLGYRPVKLEWVNGEKDGTKVDITKCKSFYVYKDGKKFFLCERSWKKPSEYVVIFGGTKAKCQEMAQKCANGEI